MASSRSVPVPVAVAVISPCEQDLLTTTPRIRHDPSWSARQGLAGSFLKLFLRAYTACHFKWPISLKPHHEGNRFVVIEPATLDFYEGVTVDSEIKPEAIGATWYPEPCSAATEVPDGQSVVLHLHGGSYVLGDGRTSSCNFLAKTLLTHTPASHLLCLQYRLACNPNGRFPAQLQDTIAAYVYLIHTLHIPPDRIVLSGDSSGGHLALAMLRYIVEYDDPCRLPPPKCSWLWSPWCDVPAAVDPDSWTQSPNYETEYIPGSFPTWGARQFLRDLAITETMERYVAPIHHPFVLPSPVLIVTGGREVLFPDHQQLVQRFQKMASNGPRIELVVEEKVPHDVLMIGWIMRFYQEAEACAKRAGEFVQRVESSERSTATVQD